MCSMQCRKALDKITKKKYPAKKFSINTPMLYVTRFTRNQNNSINSLLQYGRVAGKDCCVLFSTSGFPCLILCSR